MCGPADGVRTKSAIRCGMLRLRWVHCFCSAKCFSNVISHRWPWQNFGKRYVVSRIKENDSVFKTFWIILSMSFDFQDLLQREIYNLSWMRNTYLVKNTYMHATINPKLLLPNGTVCLRSPSACRTSGASKNPDWTTFSVWFVLMKTLGVQLWEYSVTSFSFLWFL